MIYPANLYKQWVTILQPDQSKLKKIFGMTVLSF